MKPRGPYISSWLRSSLITEEEVREKTGVELSVSEDLKTTTPPSDEELRSLRALDPERRYLKTGEF